MASSQVAYPTQEWGWGRSLQALPGSVAQRTYVAHILVPLLPPQHRQAVANISNHQAAALRCMRDEMEDLAAVRMCML